MILKIAFSANAPLQVLQKENEISNNVMIRTASGKIMLEMDSEKARIVESEIKKHPKALFFRAKAIEANKPNTNGDYFSEEELLKAYKSFEGVPFFTNHDNQDVEKARGKIVFAEWIPEEKAVYTIAFVDRDAYPHICRSIEEEYVSGVSMGASVEYSVCNICEQRAERTEDYCTHIKNRKGRKFTGSARNVNTGEVKHFKDEPVFEYNYGIKFIELSAVVDPACPSCRIEGIIKNNDYLAKAASLENSLFMLKTAAIEKKASQEEIQQIDQALQTLETIAINLIKNRKQIEVEFASDLVEIIASLQTWMDELVGAGYGNMGEGGVPGTVGNAPPANAPETNQAPGAIAPPSPVASEGGATPQAASAEMPAGQVTGSPSQPLVKGPSLPITAPIRPKSENDSDNMVKTAKNQKEMLNKIVQTASNLNEKVNKNGEEDMAKRRTIAEKQVQKDNVKKVLSESWQEKQHFIEYIKAVPSIQTNDHKLSVRRRDDSFIIVAEDKHNGQSKAWSYEDLTTDDRKVIMESPKVAAINMLQSFIKNQNKKKEGVIRMSENKKQAGATSVNEKPEVITEKQLEQGGLYHGRTGEEKDQVTQAQLESLRSGTEKDVITEKQLNEGIKLHPRDETPDVITEAQLTGDNRLDEERDQVTQAQLEPGRVGEKDVVTEKQLNEISAPWARAASRDPKLFKSAGDHMDAVLSALAETSIESGATPDELQKIAREMVNGVKGRYEFANAILDSAETPVSLPFAKRASFWASKKISVASASVADVEKIFINKLRVVASDQTINPDVLIDAVEVVNEDNNGLAFINKKIDEKLAEASKQSDTKTSVKAELRSLLTKSTDTDKQNRDAKRKAILASLDKNEGESFEEVAKKDLLNADKLGKADMVIKTSFKEVETKKDSPTFKKDVYNFTKGALASKNLRMAAITNVTISGDTIQIAIQTDEGDESVNIPIGGEAPIEGETVPEGDLSGEGAETTLGATPSTIPETSTTPPAGTTPPLPPATASSKKTIKTAQAPMGGGTPGAPASGMTPDPSGGVPGGAPMDQKPVEALMGEGAEGAEDKAIPTVGEKQSPWTICPECGESDVDVVSEENGDIKAVCKNPACGAEYQAMVEKTVTFKITKPSGEKAEGAGAAPEAPEAPEVPALPVAASTRINEKSFIRIASNKKAHGHVCPACGNKHCKASVDNAGHAECSCDKCHTAFTKDMLVNTNKPSESMLTVQWEITPDANCPECVKKAVAFASRIKAENMIRTAEANQDKFPMANCAEWVSRVYGGDTVGSFGPCKGKVLAECVCKQLQKLGFSKVRHLKKLAAASLQKDPMDECIEDQMKKNYTRKEASSICGCIQKKFANKMNTSILVQAFAEDIEEGKEPGLNLTDLVSLDELLQGENWDGKVYVQVKKEDMADEGDIGDSLPPMDSIEVDVESVGETGPIASTKSEVKTAKTTKTAQAECNKCNKCGKCCSKDCKCDADGKCTCKPDGKEEKTASTKETLEQKGEKMKEDMLMQSSRVRRAEGTNIRLAEKPTKVEDIEGNVEAGVPRKDAYMGKEKEADSMINKNMAKPNVPRSDAYMGKEKEADSFINKELVLPDVAKDSSFMGHEQEAQKGMPAINNEIKGTVIAETEKNVKQAKQMKEVETVEDDVEAGVPRAKATMGKEGPDNIDVKMDKPNVPRSDAYMGEEKSADSAINADLKSPDVPIDSAYMGHEKEVQKDMPGINDKYLKQVKMDRQVQLDRIAMARREAARDTAAWLASNGRIASDKESFDSVITALCAFEIDKIQKVAEQMFPERVKKTSSTEKPSGVAVPAIVMESKNTELSLADRLASSFTIGNSKFDKQLTIYGEK